MHNPQSLHMEYMRACEYINEIKIKLTEATVERDTLRNVLNRGAPVHQNAKRSEDIPEVNEPTGVRDVVAIEQAGESTDDPTPSEKTNELTGVRDVAAIEQAAKSINDSTPLQKMNKPTGVRDVVAIEQAGESTDDPTPSGVRDVAAIEQAAKSINDSTPSEKTNKPTGVRDVTAIEQAGESTDDPTPSGVRDVVAIEQATKSINDSTPSEKTNEVTGVRDVAAIEQAAKSINNSTPSEKTNKPTGVRDVAAIEQAAKSINNSTPSEKTNEPTEEGNSDKPKKTMPALFNPLDALVDTAIRLDVSLPPITSPSVTLTVVPSAGTSGPSKAAAVAIKTVGKKIVKMRPGPTPNGRYAFIELVCTQMAQGVQRFNQRNNS
ncbi:hypothetical protein L210DRAFT_3502711 [Boletus edulis BED1]|uniref:Uncharacterized protein n=1 Tax=Boletus edulis BED1 TaxID=1328754 RepID=A0AAD4BZL3_BOLED|nr:hypothetical protein L210DRAFT_3502711 [Boletus edulis BED1]